MSERTWIGEVRSRCVKTVFVKAANRKEAEQRLRDYGGDYFEAIDCQYDQCGPGKIIRELKEATP